MRLKNSLVALGLAAIASVAHADPCKAIPDHGPAPAYLHPGAIFAGKVVYIGDGDSLCVAVGPRADQWVEVRLADFYAPELHAPGGAQAKATLSHLAYGRLASCIADHQSYDRMVAACKVDGQPLGDLMRAAGIREGGRGRPTEDATGSPIVVTRAARGRGSADEPYYPNCAAARAAGAAPMHRGEPGYRLGLDGDHDGIACEPYRPR
jgi:endonuclease YncB( thermonuclease family)